MTIENIEARLQIIRNKADDDEHAHALEDDLRRDVLEFIAANAGDSQTRALAATALKSEDIGFSRWCA